jgi:ABC-type histidine transport system ATPase subunit
VLELKTTPEGTVFSILRDIADNGRTVVVTHDAQLARISHAT